MTEDELKEKVKLIQNTKCESQNLELKAAHEGCPRRLYDTLSSFSNQDGGGTIIFGIDESNDYAAVGVYDIQDIQKKINSQCLQMEPVVRPVLTVTEVDGKGFVSAEIPAVDIADRPCFYRGVGRIKGAYVRVGDSDEPMTEYEIYSYEAFRRKTHDEVRLAERAEFSSLDKNRVEDYIRRLRIGKTNLSQLSDGQIQELMNITQKGRITLSAVLLFGLYPQAFYPQLCVIATVVPGQQVSDLGPDKERFADNERIEGDISQMLERAMQFVRRNIKIKTIINEQDGKREDRAEYPMTAVREALLNALLHRDYSIHTEGMPVQLQLFENRLEIRSPGGIYGRIAVDQLGKVQPDTRNPVLASALEVLEIAENRYSGIPIIERELARYGLPPAQIEDKRGTFTITFYKKNSVAGITDANSQDKDLLGYCSQPRSRKEIATYLGIKTISYAVNNYIKPLVKAGKLRMTVPDSPRSHSQRYVRAD
ncbi:MAG: putative DNA binding domain-containing protein [Anaerovibrio sp.]|uniref:ATP-binding protein n=1 Tax=Anaerovibrio sp. TaxID=1872532 RepID=UPI0025F33EA4|nr:ATP-binding protein [Anaerovibrio sp.]MCR5176883.1 putative DNA binding domain-containing protein [Anaerovibrio sp.]